MPSGFVFPENNWQRVCPRHTIHSPVFPSYCSENWHFLICAGSVCRWIRRLCICSVENHAASKNEIRWKAYYHCSIDTINIGASPQGIPVVDVGIWISRQQSNYIQICLFIHSLFFYWSYDIRNPSQCPNGIHSWYYGQFRVHFRDCSDVQQSKRDARKSKCGIDIQLQWTTD